MLSKYRTRYVVCFKIGRSSFAYINDAKSVITTLDKIRIGELFSFHISSDESVSTAEFFPLQ